MGDNSGDDGKLGARLLIILYALGIVIVGAYPLQREYGGVWEFISKEYESLTEKYSVHRRSRARLNEPEVKRLSWPDAQTSDRSITKDKDLDRLTKKDRSELNDLIKDLEP